MNTRRSFFLLGGSTVALSAMQMLKPNIAFAHQDDPVGKQRLPTDLVFEFVSNAHTNLDRTKTLFEKEPKLIRANYEWAPGDFESAIDAAAHSGSIDIVKYLLEKGATYSIFVAAVLGHLDSIKAMVAHNPELINARGPHGIGLLQHALAGGEPAQKVADFLTEKGAETDEQWLDLKYDADLAKFVEGQYQITRNERSIKLSILIEDEKLYIAAGNRPKKRLQYQGQTRFAVEGTPAELLFEKNQRGESKCQRVLLKEGFPVGFAKRIK